MRSATKNLAPLVLAVVLGALLAGCEDSDVTLPSDGTIEMSANPSTVRIDPNVDQPDPETLRFTKTATVTAFVFDEENRPAQGVTLSFDTTAENPVDPASTTTDQNGRALATLTVTDLDAPQVTVTGRSGVVTGDLTVTVDVEGLNEFPRAQATIVPAQSGQVGAVVTFDGTGSADPDGNITCYQWEFLSDNPDDPAGPNPEIVQGVAASGIQRTFINEQTLAITLRVSDRSDVVCARIDPGFPGGAVEPEESFSPLAFRTNYALRCNNPAPTAVIANPDEIVVPGSASSFTSVILDGTLSFDNETALQRWVWTCGNDQTPTLPALPLPQDGSMVICKYRGGASYTATLNVVDRGTGVINPLTGTFDCQKFSETDTVKVTVTVPGG